MTLTSSSSFTVLESVLEDMVGVDPDLAFHKQPETVPDYAVNKKPYPGPIFEEKKPGFRSRSDLICFHLTIKVNMINDLSG